MPTQIGVTISDAVTIGQPEDKWTLGKVKRTCERTAVAAYPDIISRLDDEFPIGSVADNAYPLVKLAARTVEQLQRSPHHCKVKLFYEQTEPDPADLGDPVPPPERTEESGIVERPIGEHPEVQDVASDMWFWYDPEKRAMRHIPAVPQELRGRSTYPVVIRRVRITTFARTEFGEPDLNVRESPDNAGATTDEWLVTGGSNGTRGRFFTQTRVFTHDPDGYPDEIQETYETEA